MATSDSRAEIEADFPNITDAYEIVSEKATNYNCIAYVLGDLKQNWDPGLAGFIRGYYWPPGEAGDLGGLVRVFEIHGYSLCDNADVEAGFDKIAIFGDDTLWSHAAVQLPSGMWSSKLGKGHDIQHDTLHALSGDLYGKVVRIMRRGKR